MNSLTPRQEEVYEFIKQYLAENSYPPTIREISEHFQFTPKRGYDLLHTIMKKGKITIEKGKSRAIEVTEKTKPRIRLNHVPLVGEVRAGQPVFAEEYIEDTFAMPEDLIGDEELFALRVKGDSMKNAGILEGDLILIKRQNTAMNNEIIVALVNQDEATVKRYVRKSNRIELRPENPAYDPIFITKEDYFEVVGKVVWVFRKVL